MRCFLSLLGALVLAVPGASGADRSANGRIVFASDRNGAAELFSVQPDGSGLRRLTRSFPAAEDVAWAPRGGRIAFSSPDGTWDAHDLWTVRDGRTLVYLYGNGMRLVRGRNQRVLVRRGTRPAWSSDGRSVAFARGDDLVAIDVENGTESTVARSGSLVSGPTWQPATR